MSVIVSERRTGKKEEWGWSADSTSVTRMVAPQMATVPPNVSVGYR